MKKMYEMSILSFFVGVVFTMILSFCGFALLDTKTNKKIQHYQANIEILEEELSSAREENSHLRAELEYQKDY